MPGICEMSAMFQMYTRKMWLCDKNLVYDWYTLHIHQVHTRLASPNWRCDISGLSYAWRELLMLLGPVLWNLNILGLIPKIMPSTASRHIFFCNHHCLSNPLFPFFHTSLLIDSGSANENRRVYPNWCQSFHSWHNTIPRMQGLVWGMQKNLVHNWGYWLHRGN